MTLDLVVVGLSHRQAPVSLRERLAVVPAEIESYLQRLVERCGLREAVLISTCNRVELYACAENGAQALGSVREFLRAQAAGSDAADEIDRHLFHRAGREAYLHLFRVAASLDSLVVGEPQILGQVKEAYEAAERAQTVGALSRLVFSNAFRVARKVRRETGISQNPVSISSIAVVVARQVWESFAGRRVLLIGAGKMADLAARALRADGAEVAVTNRTRARAEELAVRLGCEVEPWESLFEALVRADIVISSTGAREPILRAQMLQKVQKARRSRNLVIVDIAVPRDVEPAVADLPGVLLFDIDALQTVAKENLADRRQEADRAEAMVEHELRRFLDAGRGRAVGPAIAAIRAKVQNVARGEAEKTLAGLPGLDERARRAVLQMADAIVNKLAHAPSVALKKGAAGEDGDALVNAAYKLFDLPPVEPVQQESEDDDEPGDKANENAPAAAKKAAHS